jgi:hypothetical protein
VDDIFAHALKKQTGVSLRYMLDFGSNPIDRQLLLSAQFLHKELPVRLAHRVAELENLPYGLSGKVPVLKVCSSSSGGSRQQQRRTGSQQQHAASRQQQQQQQQTAAATHRQPTAARGKQTAAAAAAAAS